MEKFNFETDTYEFDANRCYDTTGLVLLPDGRVLRVTGWFESYPPIPAGFKVVEVVSAIRVS